MWDFRFADAESHGKAKRGTHRIKDPLGRHKIDQAELPSSTVICIGIRLHMLITKPNDGVTFVFGGKV